MYTADSGTFVMFSFLNILSLKRNAQRLDELKH